MAKVKSLSQLAYEAYYGPMFDYKHTSDEKKRRFAKVARVVAKASRTRK